MTKLEPLSIEVNGISLDVVGAHTAQAEINHWKQQIQILWEIGSRGITAEHLDNARNGVLVLEEPVNHLELVNDALSYFGSRSALGDYLGVNPATVSAWRMGRQVPRAEYVLAMQNYLAGGPEVVGRG